MDRGSSSTKIDFDEKACKLCMCSGIIAAPGDEIKAVMTEWMKNRDIWNTGMPHPVAKYYATEIRRLALSRGESDPGITPADVERHMRLCLRKKPEDFLAGVQKKTSLPKAGPAAHDDAMAVLQALDIRLADVDLVASQAGVSQQIATEALISAKGDLVDAILHL